MRKILYKLGCVLSVICSPIVNIYHKLCNYIRVGYKTRGMHAISMPITIHKNVRIVGVEKMSFGKNITIDRDTTLYSRGESYNSDVKLSIGNDCSIGQGCHITAANSITLGNGVLLGKYVTITDNSHGKVSSEEYDVKPISRLVFSKGKVHISDNVWIGDKATILPNVKIGEGAIIGANSVVTTDIPAGCVAAGIPARIIKKYH